MEARSRSDHEVVYGCPELSICGGLLERRKGRPLSSPRALDLSAVPESASRCLGHTVWHFAVLPSTNDLLKRMVLRGQADHGTVVVTDLQTAGRGRQGRVWHAEAGSSLLMSIYLSPIGAHLTYCVCALAVRDAVSDLVNHRAELKWPNDVLIDGKKVCGILAERVSDGVVVGFGVNSNMTCAELARIGAGATSLRLASRQPVDQAQLFDRLLTSLEQQYERSRRSPDAVFRAWRSALITPGKIVEVETPREKWIGRAVDVAEDGSLLVSNDKRIVRVYAADVRLRSH